MPAINRENVGTLTPADLLGAMSLYDAQYGAEE